MAVRYLACLLFLSLSSGLRVQPFLGQKRTKCSKTEFGGFLVGLVCATQAVAISPPAFALDLDYNDLYKSSATANQPGFKLNGPPPAPAKKKETPPAEIESSKVPDAKIDIPKVDVPTLPKLEIPDIPKAPEMPKFDMPKAPEVSIPKVEIPKAPEVSLPKVDLALPTFNGGSSAAKTESPPVFVDIEALDQRARETKQDFKAADNIAKDAETQARALRKIANEKKKVFQEAKDAACENRPGGKLFCIRGLGAGF